MEIISPSPQIEQSLYGKVEDELDLGSSEAFDGEDVEEGARKGKVPTASPPLRQNKRRAGKEKVRVTSYRPVNESVIMGKRFQSFVTEERLTSLRAEFQIPDLITLRAPSVDERPCNM